MAAYLTVSYNHFAALQRWAQETGGQASVDLRDFTMEVKHRGRYYRMFPMFQGRVQGRLTHLSRLTPDVQGFGGWRPYQTLTHPHSSDKKLFKAWLQECGLRCPQALDFDGTPPAQDYVLKAPDGSFGVGLFGPFRAGTQPVGPAGEQAARGELFAEQFVPGRMLKVWYWGARPFFAHMQAYPALAGDGRSSVGDLLRARVALAGLQWDTFPQKPIVLGCLAYQGLDLDDTLAEGQQAWIDFRYGQLYDAPRSSLVSDNQLEDLAQRSGEQLQQLGQALARLLQQAFPAPVVMTVDGLLDDEGRIWWLEMNTNSLLPPEGYAAMFSDLFA